MDKPHCIIFGNTVTALCTAVPDPAQANNMCDLGKNQNIVTVPSGDEEIFKQQSEQNEMLKAFVEDGCEKANGVLKVLVTAQ
ncbi:hypothetical protein KIN20_026683 [Parelaphostrongylus tenuis]|uniref:Uncharacterized protein n=1 Tax=Parelaphostrongylus tenuis TaxID=148309 RepID=A0AAD5QYB4_PARTN|nr:hypothetical protein KIN20_026683 [Parelaphostrongylus tenuis]